MQQSKSLLALALAVVTAHALSGQAPDRVPAAKPTASIVGRVVEAGTNRPVPNALVSLSHGDEDARRVVADDQGRFLFRDLVKGSYGLGASRSGYVLASYGKHWPVGSGRSSQPLRSVLEIAEGEQVRDVTLRMWQYGGLSGRVVDEKGEPLVGVTVVALTVTAETGRRTYAFDTAECSGSVCLKQLTDDRGVYRFSVLPGEYIVAVPSVAYSWPLALQRQALTGSRGATSIGLSSRDALGWIGGGGVSAVLPSTLVGDDRFGLPHIPGTPTLASLTDDGRLSVYAMQFYSSAAMLSQATVVSVASAEERAGIDFSLRAVPAQRISGRLLGPSGPVPNVMLQLLPANQEQLNVQASVGATASDADGAFVFLGVPAGPYVIRVLLRPQRATDNAPNFTGVPTIRTISSEPYLWAQTAANAGSEDVQVVMRPAARVSGRVEFLGSAPKPARIPTIRIERANGRDLLDMTLPGLDPQGRFMTDGHLPGQYFVRMPFPPAGWTFQSAMLNGRDVSDVPFELGTEDVSGIVITLTDRAGASIAGTVSRSAGTPDPTAVVVVFPADRQLWVNTGENPRRFGIGGTDWRGAFSIAPLPAGEYFVAALSGDEAVLWNDAALLADLARTATRIRLSDGERQSVALQTRRSR